MVFLASNLGVVGPNTIGRVNLIKKGLSALFLLIFLYRHDENVVRQNRQDRKFQTLRSEWPDQILMVEKQLLPVFKSLNLVPKIYCKIL